MAKILSLVGGVGAKSAMKWAFGGLSAALAIGVGVGCSSSTTSDPYPTSDSWAASLANAECAVVFNECGDSESECVAQRTTFHQAEAVARTTGSRKYNSAYVQACLDATTAAYKDTPALTASDKATMDDKCERVFQGSTAEFQPCASDYECSGTYICDPIKLACGPQNTIADGQQCNNVGDECGASQYCAKNGATSVCTPRPGIGDACVEGTEPCAPGAYCSNSNCVAQVETGSACTADEQCATGLICDPYNIVNGSLHCDSGERFAPGSTSCSYFGDGMTPPTVGGSTTVTEDAGTTEDAATTDTDAATTVDSGSADASLD